MKFTKLLSVILACVMLMGVFTVLPVSAAKEASIEIVANNVLYGAEQQIMYAVSAPEDADVKLYLCDDANGTNPQEAEFFKMGEAKDGPAVEGCYIFLSKGMPVYNAAEKVYAYAEIVGGEKTEIHEYSVLEYLYKAMFVATTLTETDVALCRAHYEFALAWQKTLSSEAEFTPIDSLVYVMVAENGTVGGKTAGVYAINEAIDTFATTLVPAANQYVSWKFNIYDINKVQKNPITIAADELAADGFTPTMAGLVIATPSVVGEATADPVDISYNFANFSGTSTQYADEVHDLGDFTLTITKCHINGELRIYSSGTNNGKAIIYADGAIIQKLVVNAGNKADTLNVYGSTDGKNFDLITGLTTQASYKNLTAEIEGNYTYIMLDVAGTQQVRVKNLTLTVIPQ